MTSEDLGRNLKRRADFVRYHLSEALRAALAEADGDADLARRLNAKTKLRLICMSDEELWELAKLTAAPVQKPVELVYKEIQQAVEQHRATTSKWMNDVMGRMPESGEH